MLNRELGVVRYWVLQTSQMKLILLCVWAAPAAEGCTLSPLDSHPDTYSAYHTSDMGYWEAP